METMGVGLLGSRQGNPNRANGFFGCSTIGSGYAGCGNGVVGVQKCTSTLRHLSDNGFADGTIAVEVRRTNTKDVLFYCVVVGNDTAVVERRTTGVFVEEMSYLAARATFCRSNGLAALFEDIADQHLNGQIFGGERQAAVGGLGQTVGLLCIEDSEKSLYLPVDVFGRHAITTESAADDIRL